MNKAFISGNIVYDLELKQSGTGSFLNLTVVTSDRWTDRKTEEKREDSQFHKIVVFGKNAEVIAQYFKKGDKIFVEGKIKYESYNNKEGIKLNTTKIILDKFEFMNNRKSETREEGQDKSPEKSPPKSQQRQNTPNKSPNKSNKPAINNDDNHPNNEFEPNSQDPDDNIPF